LCFALILPSPAYAADAIEVTADDYALAAQWLRPNMVKLVKNLQVSPHWIGDTDEFWYRRDTADGHDFVVVEAASGEKKSAFDHVALAGGLKKAGFEDVDPDDLPFASFSYVDDRTAVTFTVTDDDAGPTGDYRCEFRGGCALVEETPAFAIPEGALVSPDGSRCVISEGGNLFLFDLKTGAKRALTSDGEEHFGYGLNYGNWQARFIPEARAGKRLPPMEAYWAPDSRHLLATRLDERHVEPYPFVVTAPHDGSFRPQLYQPRVPLVGEEPAKVDWFVFDTDTGRQVRLNLPYEELFHVHQDMLAIRKTWWSEDGARLWAVAWGLNLEGAYLYEIDTATGGYRTVIEEHMAPRTDTNSTSYNLPNVHVTADGAEVVWFSQRSGWGHLYLYDGKTGKLKKPITSGDWLVRDIIRVDDANRLIYFTGGGREGGNPYYRYLYRVDFDGSGLKLLTPETADHLINAPNDVLLFASGAGGLFSPSGSYIAYNYSTIDQPTRFVIRRASNAKLVAEVERADVSALYETGWTDPEPFVVKAADGATDLYGIIYKPIGFDPEVRYPVIDSQYASPLTAVVPHDFAAGLVGVPALIQPTNLRAMGFVCFVVDARGTTYRSRSWWTPAAPPTGRASFRTTRGSTSTPSGSRITWRRSGISPPTGRGWISSGWESTEVHTAASPRYGRCSSSPTSSRLPSPTPPPPSCRPCTPTTTGRPSTARPPMRTAATAGRRRHRAPSTTPTSTACSRPRT